MYALLLIPRSSSGPAWISMCYQHIDAKRQCPLGVTRQDCVIRAALDAERVVVRHRRQDPSRLRAGVDRHTLAAPELVTNAV